MRRLRSIPRLAEVDGVGEVTPEGAAARAVRLQVNPRQLSALGLSLEDVRRAIEGTTTDLPKGQIDGPRQTLQVGANDQLFAAKDFRDAIIAYRNGAPVKFTDIGQAVDGLENEKLAAWYNGKPALILNVKRQPGANIIAVVDAIKELLPAIQKSAPRGLSIDIAADRTTTIRTAVYDVQKTLAITVALVILVIFLFLRKFWATLIPSVTLPVTLIATFGMMAALGFSLDNLSLMALSIASGFIVDDAIVMIENIVRYIEAGDRPIDAALKGSRQIGFTIVSLTISLVAVFIPLLLMGGVVGRLFREFSITLSVAIVISGILSLILTPMMCATLLKREDAAESRLVLPKHRARFRCDARRLRGRPDLVAAPQDNDAGAHDPDFRRQHLALRPHSERFRARAGYRADRRRHRRGAGRFVREHVAVAAADRRNHRPRS